MQLASRKKPFLTRREAVLAWVRNYPVLTTRQRSFSLKKCVAPLITISRLLLSPAEEKVAEEFASHKHLEFHWSIARYPAKCLRRSLFPRPTMKKKKKGFAERDPRILVNSTIIQRTAEFPPKLDLLILNQNTLLFELKNWEQYWGLKIENMFKLYCPRTLVKY